MMARRIMEENMAKTVKITTDDKIKVMDIPWNLKGWESAIEADCTENVYTRIMYQLFGDRIIMIVDESGAVKHRPVNKVASYLYGAQEHGTCIYGDVLFARQTGPDTVPLENAELVKFFLKDHFTILEE